MISTDSYFLVIVGYCVVDYNNRAMFDKGFMGKGDESIQYRSS